MYVILEGNCAVNVATTSNERTNILFTIAMMRDTKSNQWTWKITKGQHEGLLALISRKKWLHRPTLVHAYETVHGDPLPPLLGLRRSALGSPAVDAWKVREWLARAQWCAAKPA